MKKGKYCQFMEFRAGNLIETPEAKDDMSNYIIQDKLDLLLEYKESMSIKVNMNAYVEKQAIPLEKREIEMTNEEI